MIKSHHFEEGWEFFYFFLQNSENFSEFTFSPRNSDFFLRIWTFILINPTPPAGLKSDQKSDAAPAFGRQQLSWWAFLIGGSGIASRVKHRNRLLCCFIHYTFRPPAVESFNPPVMNYDSLFSAAGPIISAEEKHRAQPCRGREEKLKGTITLILNGDVGVKC